jgi:hypothetical protein
MLLRQRVAAAVHAAAAVATAAAACAVTLPHCDVHCFSIAVLLLQLLLLSDQLFS